MSDLRVVKIDELLKEKTKRREWCVADLDNCINSSNPRMVSEAIKFRDALDKLDEDIASIRRLRALIVEVGEPDEGAPSFPVMPRTH